MLYDRRAGAKYLLGSLPRSKTARDEAGNGPNWPAEKYKRRDTPTRLLASAMSLESGKWFVF
jgi:hypothetical protein